MLTLAPCPHCATRVPDDGAFCDSCGRQLAACPTCGELARPGEKCIKHGVPVALRPSAAPGTQPAPAPVVGPTVQPPPRRGATAAPPVIPPVPPSPAPGAVAPTHGAQATTVQVLARQLRLVITSGETLAPLDVDPGTIVGRGEGPFALLLDQFHNKGVSRRHCQFQRTPTGGWTITDLAGKGSTFVGVDARFAAGPMPPNGTAPVEPGRDQVKIGMLTFRVDAVP